MSLRLLALYPHALRPVSRSCATSSPSTAGRGPSATSTPTSRLAGTPNSERRSSPRRGHRGQGETAHPQAVRPLRARSYEPLVGGDISAFYAAIGEFSRPPSGSASCRSTAPDSLIGCSTPWAVDTSSARSSSPTGRRVSHRRQKQDRHNKFVWLASQSLNVIQLEEAMDRPPELKEFGTPAFEGHADVLYADVDRSVCSTTFWSSRPCASSPRRRRRLQRRTEGLPQRLILQSARPQLRLFRRTPDLLATQTRCGRLPELPPQPVQAPVAEERGSWFRRRRGR